MKIDHLTTEQKYQMLEDLMNDLKKVENELQSPNWHEEALKQTEQRLSVGEEKIVDWETAKNFFEYTD